MSDLISRQDAIEAIAKRIYHIEDGSENDALRKAICDIDEIPSVNAIPYDSTITLNSPTIIKATSTDLISRQDIKYHVQLEAMGNGQYEEVEVAYKNDIESLPSADAVQIPIKLEKRYPQSRNEDITDAFMRGYLAGRSSADRSTGEWQKEIKGNGWNEWAVLTCDQCGAVIKDPTFETNYCPSCGARMGGGPND